MIRTLTDVQHVLHRPGMYTGCDVGSITTLSGTDSTFTRANAVTSHITSLISTSGNITTLHSNRVDTNTLEVAGTANNKNTETYTKTIEHQ